MWLYALPRTQRTICLVLAVFLSPVMVLSIIASQADALPRSSTAPHIRQTLDGRTVSITSVTDCTQEAQFHAALDRIDDEWGWATTSQGTMQRGRRLWVNPETGWAGVVSWRQLPGDRIRMYRSEMDLARLPLLQIEG